jgi:hypothetical protein
MNNYYNYLKPTFLTMSVCAALFSAFPTAAEDIDIFVSSSAGSSANPNVLIVLDNTSNWARQSQQWPGGLQQGQSEANAIKTVIQSLNSNVNVGLMEFVTGGNANDDGGFIRSAIQPMTAANKTSFSSQLTTIYNNVTSPDEKRNSNTPYGNLMYDVYNYYAGANAYSPGGVLASIADSNGYTTNYSRFKSPLSSTNTCAKNFVIFIGNPNASGPASDIAANTTALTGLGGNATQLGLPSFTPGTVTTNTELGNTSQCYSSLASAQAAYGLGLNTIDNVCQLYSAIGSFVSSATDMYGATCKKYTGTGADTVAAAALDFNTQCSTFTQGCIIGDAVSNPTLTVVDSAQTGYLTSAPAATSADAGAKAGLTCPADAISCTYTVSAAEPAPTIAATTGLSTSCYYTGNGSNPDHLAEWTDPLSNGGHDYGTLTCPANYTCSYSKTGNDQDAVCQAASGNVKKAILKQTPTPTIKYTVTRTISKVGGSCPVNTNQYKVMGTNKVITNVATGTTSPDTGPRNADEWSRLLYQKGIPVSGVDVNPSVATYTIDVYNKQPNAIQTALLLSMAKAGGGKYFSATNESAIVAALEKILVEIQAVNSTFASTSLPVNATNRTQSENEVFIGMFRPDTSAKPRWFGNLKRYQLINVGGSIELGDSSSPAQVAVNPVTGFITECAISFWTTASGTYWKNVTDGTLPTSALLDPASVQGKCPGYEQYSDLPDGPLVEKGAVAEILRQGNNPPGTSSSPTWAVNRTVYTQSGTTLTAFNTTSSGLSSTLVDFMRGKDVNDEKGTGDTTGTRPSIHGDVIHSRPLPINYGDGIVVYYGSNDGTLRAVEATSGKEKWAFIAPEFFPRLSRLMTDSPLVSFRPNPVTGSTPKDYFFDGSIGFYQSADNSKIWIFPTMRRGGRMIYAFNVKTPDSPVLKWKVGCPNLSNDNDCTAGMGSIGQTWSVPRGARIKGYSTTAPVLIVGGGYDACEDDNSASPVCTGTKGGVVYILNADTGEKITSFATTRGVAADVALLDIDGDGYADYAYAADIGGNIYRIDFISNPNGSRTPLGVSDWTSHRVAYTNGAGRKFLFAPALFANSGKAYVAIGSGDREHPLLTDYPYTDVVNRFYVYKDDLASTSATDMDSLENYTNTTCNTAPILPSSTAKGWFKNLNQNGQGEQTVTSALIATGMVTFSTNRPLSTEASCSNSLGEARGYWVNLLNGSGAIGVDGLCGGAQSATFVGGGLPPSPVLARAVPINGRATTVVIGAVKKNSGKAIGVNAVVGAQTSDPNIISRRTRTYSYATGDN